ncbi:MAG: hypothetical protein H0X62_11230, partial [Bacteroidetes bacterium]|nr:hypothetical protein [Bacteroidota bacterium]
MKKFILVFEALVCNKAKGNMLLFYFFLLAFAAKSQVYTFGNGTFTSSNTVTPYKTANSDGRTQYLIWG